MIPYGRQSISASDVAAVAEVLCSDFLTQGPAVPRFEEAVATRCGVQYSIAVNSATSALHLACLALDIGPGDRVWTSPNTFVASANCARFCGADVDFVDIDPKTYNLCPDRLEEKLKKAQRTKRLPKAIIPVHFAGQSCDMARIDVLAKQYSFAVIEDAAHAIGGEYRGRVVGGCDHSDISVFSFHPVKLITTGEGGMALTRRAVLHDRIARLRTHGITREVSQTEQSREGGWYYEQVDLGWNYRMTDIQAALGWEQLQRLDRFVERRRALAARYNRLLKGLPVTLPWQHPDIRSAWHLYVVLVNDRPRRAVYDAMRNQGIGVQVHYIPVHLQPYYRELGFKSGDFPEAEAYYARCLSLPLYPDLTGAQQDEVVHALRKALAA